VKKQTVDLSLLLLLCIVLIVLSSAGAMIFYAAYRDNGGAFNDNDGIINTLFIFENNEDKPLCTYLAMQYPQTKRAAVFNIPGVTGRILTKVNRVDRIDSVYKKGAPKDFINEVEALLDVDINYYMVFSLPDLEKTVDLLDGVPVTIPNEIEIYKGKDSFLLPSGRTLLDGDKSIEYITYIANQAAGAPQSKDAQANDAQTNDAQTNDAQTKNTQDSAKEIKDEAPAGIAASLKEAPPLEDVPPLKDRQDRFFLGFFKKLGEESEYLKKPRVRDVFSSLVFTNMSGNVKESLFAELAKTNMDRISVLDVEGVYREVSGKRLLIPAYDATLVKDIVRKTFASLTRESDSGRRVTIEVLNGTNIPGLASRTSELIRAYGYDVIKVDNADRSDYDRTEIISRIDQSDEIKTFSEYVNCKNIINAKAETSFDLNTHNYETKADFTLILGRDFNAKFSR